MATKEQSTRVVRDEITRFVMRVLDEYNIEYVEDPQYPLNGWQRSQIRHKRSADSVKTSKARYEAGLPVPPIVVTADNHVADGNGRIEASEALKRPTIYALVIKKTRDELGADLVDAIGAELNKHGTSLSTREKEAQMRAMIEAGATNKVIQQRLLVLGREVTALRAEMTGERRVASVGISLARFSKSQIKKFGTLKLMDAPFGALVHLTADAGLTAGDLNELAARTQAKGSESEQMSLLAGEREQLVDQIRQHQLTGNGQPPLSRKVKRAAGAFLHLTGNLGGSVEQSHERAAEQARTLEDLIKRATLLLGLQRKVLESIDE